MQIIQAELTWDKRIQLHENNKAICRQFLIREINVSLHSYLVSTIFISSDALMT